MCHQQSGGGAQKLRPSIALSGDFPVILAGARYALVSGMKPPSEARKRTLALQERTLSFSTGVNLACPVRFTNVPSATVWGQLVRAADSTSKAWLGSPEAAAGYATRCPKYLALAPSSIAPTAR